MKNLLTLAVAVLSTFTFAASCQWSAAALSADYNGGMAYLVQTTNSGLTAATIKNALGTTGIAATLPSGYYHSAGLAVQPVASEDQLFYGSYAAYDSNSYTVGYTSNDPSAATMTAFVIVLSQDQKTFVMTDITTISGDGVEFLVGTTEDWTATDPSEWAFSGDIYDPNAGTGGGSQGGVPEPTVLALLALGVAGVALRRKVA